MKLATKIPAAKERSGSKRRDFSQPFEGLGRRERNKLEKKNRIVAAARTLFRDNGYDNTTTQEIAECAGIASGTLFLYTASKEDLLVLVFKDEMLEVLQKAFRGIPENASLVDGVEQLFGGFIAYHKRDIPLARRLIRELTFLSNRDRLRDIEILMANIFRMLQKLIIDAKKAGRIRKDADTLIAARTFFSIYYQLLQAWLGGYTSYAGFRQSLRESLALTISGMEITAGQPSAKDSVRTKQRALR